MVRKAYLSVLMNQEISEKAARIGSIAAEARALRSPKDFSALSQEEVEFFFAVRADTVRRDHKAQRSAVGSSSFLEATRTSRFGSRSLPLQPTIRFFRGNVRAFRASCKRISGVRLVLLPAIAVFYLTGIHRLKSRTPDRSRPGGLK